MTDEGKAAARESSGAAGAERAPWPGWVSMAEERALAMISSCSGHPEYWALHADATGGVSPRRGGPRSTARWDALPVEPLPPELARPVTSGAERTVIEGPTAWLVALDAGEFGGGLYSVNKQSRQAVRLDAHLPEAVRTIREQASGVVAIAGLCHGEGCARATHVYSVERAADWKLVPLAELPGCPVATVGFAGAHEALLVTCNAVHSVRGSGVAVVASWQNGFSPVHASDAAARDSTGAVYVSFGPVVARFGSGAVPEWLGPRESSCGTR